MCVCVVARQGYRLWLTVNMPNDLLINIGLPIETVKIFIQLFILQSAPLFHSLFIDFDRPYLHSFATVNVFYRILNIDI